jgi:uncharacterized membrane protein YfcA
MCLAGLAVGALTGFLGVGGGFVTVPVLTVALGFPLRSAMGTSVVAIAVLALLGLVAHVVAGGDVGGAPTAILAAGCVAGAVVGARSTPRVPQRTLAGAFATLVAAIAVAIAAAAVS